MDDIIAIVDNISYEWRYLRSLNDGRSYFVTILDNTYFISVNYKHKCKIVQVTSGELEAQM